MTPLTNGNFFEASLFISHRNISYYHGAWSSPYTKCFGSIGLNAYMIHISRHMLIFSGLPVFFTFNLMLKMLLSYV